jgi:uncharacterized Zn-finger protein
MPNTQDSKKSLNLEEELATTRKVFCQGTAPSNHPKVYLFIIDKQIKCPYCSKCFIFKGKD